VRGRRGLRQREIPGGVVMAPPFLYTAMAEDKIHGTTTKEEIISGSAAPTKNKCPKNMAQGIIPAGANNAM